MGQGCAPDRCSEAAELAECDGEAGDVADDSDGLAPVLLGDGLEHLAHAGRDREAGLAVRDLLCQVVVDHPGAEHISGLPSDGRVVASLVLADADLYEVGQGLDLDAECGGQWLGCLSPAQGRAGVDRADPLAAQDRSTKVAVAKCAWSGRERLAALLQLRDDAIVLPAMRWPDEVRNPAAETDSEEELEQALAVIDRMTQDDLDGHEFTDTSTDALAKIIEAKREEKLLSLSAPLTPPLRHGRDLALGELEEGEVAALWWPAGISAPRLLSCGAPAHRLMTASRLVRAQHRNRPLIEEDASGLAFLVPVG